MDRDYQLEPARAFQSRSTTPRHPEWSYVYEERLGILTDGRRQPTELEEEMAVRDATNYSLRLMPFRKS